MLRPLMSSPLSLLRFPTRAPALSPELARLRELVLPLAGPDGLATTQHPGLCVYKHAGESRYSKAPTFGVTLGIVLEGEKRVRLGDWEETVRAGDLLVVTREANLEVTVGGGAYLGVALCFCPERVAKALLDVAGEADGADDDDTAPGFVAPAEPRLLDAVYRLVAATRDPDERRVLVPLGETEVLFHLLRSPAAAALRRAVGDGSDRARMLDALRFIQDNAAKRITVRDVARHVAMSESHFAHRFRDVARITPMRYLREVRLENARTLLAAGRRVSEVAVEVGFDSASHFTREFKRRYGQPPTAWRRTS